MLLKFWSKKMNLQFILLAFVDAGYIIQHKIERDLVVKRHNIIENSLIVHPDEASMLINEISQHIFVVRKTHVNFFYIFDFEQAIGVCDYKIGIINTK